MHTAICSGSGSLRIAEIVLHGLEPWRHLATVGHCTNVQSMNNSDEETTAAFVRSFKLAPA